MDSFIDFMKNIAVPRLIWMNSTEEWSITIMTVITVIIIIMDKIKRNS